MYLPAASAGKNTLDVRWIGGVWLGIKLGSGESIIGTADGVVKAREFRRRPEEGRCRHGGIDGLKGVPWDPCPGAGRGLEIKSRVRLPADSGRIIINIEGKGD